MECPDENTLVMILARDLPPAEHAELGEHIDSCDHCRQLLAALVAGSKAPETRTAQSRLAVGTTAEPGLAARTSAGRYGQGHLVEEPLNRYSILGEHARGGQARVMRAYDEFVGREIAIKELLPDSDGAPRTDSSISAVRFLREARITGQLAHPGIVPVHEIGRRADGQLYYTMELVKGRTLADALAACDGLDERLKLLVHFVDVCHAIAYAHNLGVVHRDIKPQNVMVGEFGVTNLLDWGLAKARKEPRVDSAGDGETPSPADEPADLETIDGCALGTPAYMSPEQARGDVDEIDELSDIWGLGAVLYELLTGRPPFRGKGVVEILDAIQNGDLAPVRSICPEAPAELAAVADKALSRDKAERYQRASELAEEVSAYMTGRRVSAYEYSSWELLRRFAARNKAAIVAATAILAVIIVSLAVVWKAYRREAAAHEREAAAHQRATSAHENEVHARRLEAFHLAQAYAAEADRLTDDKRLLEARILAAASLAHNPANSQSPFHSPGFAEEVPDSRKLNVKAASTHLLATLSPVTRCEKTLQLDTKATTVEFSRGGGLLVAGSDKTIWLWDASDYRQLHVIEGHADLVSSVAFSPDDRVMATASYDRTVKLWKLPEGELLTTLEGHEKEVHAVGFSPDGRLLASAGYDGLVAFWDPATGRQVRRIQASEVPVSGLAFSPDGALVAAGGEDRVVRTFEVATGKPIREMRGHVSPVMALVFHPDGNRLISASLDRSVRTWDASTGKELSRVDRRAYRMALSRDGRWLAQASGEDYLYLVDMERGELAFSIRAHADAAWGSALSPDGTRWASASRDGTVKVWRLNPQIERLAFSDRRGEVKYLLFSHDGRMMASVNEDGTITLWDPTRGAPLRRLGRGGGAVYQIEFSPDNKELGALEETNVIRFWSVADGRETRKLEGVRAYGFNWSPDGSRLLMGHPDGTCTIRDAKTLEPLLTLAPKEEDRKEILSHVFSPDGRLVATGETLGGMRLWDATSGKELRRFIGHKDAVSGLAFSGDGRRLFSSGFDGLVFEWDVATGESIRRIEAEPSGVLAFGPSPHDKYATSLGFDRTVTIWKLPEWEVRMVMRTESQIWTAAFSLDEERLYLNERDLIRMVPADFSALEADPSELLQKAQRDAALALDGFELKVSRGRHKTGTQPLP